LAAVSHRLRSPSAREQGDFPLPEPVNGAILAPKLTESGECRMKPRTLLEKLKVKTKYKTFEGWGTKMAKAAGTPHDQRQLMATAGAAERTGGGLSWAQAAQLSDRSRAVLLRDDPQYFPGLAGLDDHQKIQTLFARVLRSEAFSRG